ncbi:MAG: hypothetical protein KF838_05145 [Phycisphaeraceae bacterium]|nr:MAG: hypothetical protein KF838_05145 [Phycisphaeraceae bacterium]
MKLTRERKVYLMLLVLGGGVLGMDQLIGGPSAASASHSPADAQQAPAAALAGSTAQPLRVPLHQRLLQLDQDSGASLGVQIFDIDPIWRAELAPQEVARTDSSPASVIAPQVILPKVSMVVQDAKGGFAMMDGKPVRVGEATTSGAVLVSVESGSVTVEVSGTLHTIVVAR